MLSSGSVAGFVVDEAVQQPGGVEHVNHKHTEQQFSDGAPLGPAIPGLGKTRREHGSKSRLVSKSTQYSRRPLACHSILLVYPEEDADAETNTPHRLMICLIYMIFITRSNAISQAILKHGFILKASV